MSELLPEAMTINGIAKHWGLSHWTVRTWIRQGRIASFKVGRRILVRVDDIRELIAESYRPARIASAVSRPNLAEESAAELPSRLFDED